MTHPLTLVGDGIENPWNARTMLHAAAMFGGDCLFRDRAKLAVAWRETGLGDTDLRLVAAEDIADRFQPVVAFDTLEGAESIYGFRLPAGECPAVIVGNERRGIAHDMQGIASYTVQVPLVSRTLNSLNVAAASAVALYYLTHGGGAPIHVSANPHQRRPDLLLIGGADHFELGSTIRSAGAFGWQRLLIEDRGRVWFSADRVTQSEGRAAARRARNPIRLIPSVPTERYAFERVSIITTKADGVPPHRAHLAGGARHLIVIPDESHIDVTREDWRRVAKDVTFVRLDVPVETYIYHYRLIATIVLAEIARQVGQPATAARRTRRTPRYDFAIPLRDGANGEVVSLEDLERY